MYVSKSKYLVKAYNIFIVARHPSTPCLKNVPPLACYNFDAHEWILILFGRNVTDKVGNQKKRRFTMPPQITCASALYLAKRGNTKSTWFTQLDCVTRTMHLCAAFLKGKVVTCDVFDSVRHLLR